MRLDDELFVNRCLEGDQAAFTCLVSKYKEMVHAYAYYKVGDDQDAQDIAQEVFIKAYSKLGQLKWPHRFQSWLYSIVANECKMWLRKRSKEREQEVHLEDVPADELSGLAMRPHDDEDMEETVTVAMESLPADSQLALSLYYMSNLSIKEIAYFLGTSPGNVKVKLHRARKQLGERSENMLGRQLRKKKLRSGFIVTVVDFIKDMPIPSLSKPRPIRWAPIPISIGMALLIGIIGYGGSSGKGVSPDILALKPTAGTFEVSLLPDNDGETFLDMEGLDTGSEDIHQSDLAWADAGTAAQTQPVAGTKSPGGVVRRVWETALDSDGRVSPNGRYISYINWDSGNLAIHDLETGKNSDVTDEGHWGMDQQFADMSVWSPDSKQIAYLWLGPKGSSLRIVGIDGSRPHVLYSSSEWDRLSPRTWSQDGKYILANRCRKKDETHDHNILLVSVADGSMRVLKSLGPRHYWHQMSLSPDGRYVVYHFPQSKDSPKYDISLLATDGSYETTLVKHPARDGAPFWAPDGNRIVFTSDRSGTWGLWVLEVIDGKPKGSPHLISDNLNGMSPLGLTQDGSYYYRLPGRENDIYFADLDPETGKVILPPTKAIQKSEGLNSQPAFSPDGKRLVYVARRGPGGWHRSKSLVICSLETGEERELQPEFPLEELSQMPGSTLRWSPDGRSILVWAKVTDAVKETRSGLHQIHVETGAVNLVVWDDEQGSIYKPTPPVWSLDGSKIFFMRQGGGFRIYDLDARQEQQLHFHWLVGAKGCAPGLALSPDGRQLAFIVNFDDRHSLCIAPSAGGEMREVFRLPKAEIPPFPDGAWLVWMPDGDHLLFAKRKDEATELWRISVDGGELQNLGLAMRKIEHLNIRPDGRSIAFTGPGPTPGAEVWVMENLLPTPTASR